MRTSSDKRADESALQAWRTNTLNIVLIVVAVAVPAAMYSVIIDAIQTPAQQPAGIVFAACYVFVLIAALFRRLNFYLRGWGLLLVGYTAGALAFMRGGLAGDGRVYILGLPVIAFILFGVRTGFATAFISLVLYAVFGALAHAGQMGNWLLPRFQANPLSARDWFQGGLNVIMILAPVAALLWRFIRFHEKTSLTEQKAITEWERASTLANEHAAELEKANTLLAERTEMLTAAAEVTHQVASLTDEQGLMERFVQLLAWRLRLYDAGLFLLDDQDTYAILRAASSEERQEMVQRGYQVLVGSEDPVGKAAQGIETMVSPSPAASSDLSRRWRVALPLQVRGEILGALDIYFGSDQAPSQEQVQILRTLADQLATSLKNSRLLQEVQASLEAERQARGELSRQGWQDILRAQRELSFARSKSGLATSDTQRQEMETALRTGQLTLGQDDPSILALPLKARDQIIGVIEARQPEGAAGWTPENVALLETLIDQLGVALESARLYQDTQRRAAQEQLTGEITTRIRESLDINAVLQIAAREMRQALNLAQVEVRMGQGTTRSKSETNSQV